MKGSIGDIPDPVAEGVLLEEFFGEVLEVPLGERNGGGHGDGLVACTK